MVGVRVRGNWLSGRYSSRQQMNQKIIRLPTHIQHPMKVMEKSVGWCFLRPNPIRAGYRYRCIYPMNALARRGYHVGMLNDDSENFPDVAVFDSWSLFHGARDETEARALLCFAEKIRLRGVRVVVDECDNRFVGSRDSRWASRCDMLIDLAALADVMVTCTRQLAEVVRDHCRLSRLPTVIGDPVEDRIFYPGDSPWRSIWSVSQKLSWLRFSTYMLKLAIARIAGRYPLVWFGHHGNNDLESGMISLASIRNQLEAVNRKHPIVLGVISNNRHKFDRIFSGWTFPVLYLEWDRRTFIEALRLHRLCVLPSPINEFTRTKSANRLQTSVYHGLNVVCDPLPSYRDYSEFVGMENWTENILKYINDPSLCSRHLSAGKASVISDCHIETIARKWIDVFFPDDAPGSSRLGTFS